MDWITITSISTLYKTTMTQAYTRIRILGDETVDSALQSKLDREKIGSSKIPSSHIRELWSSWNAWVGWPWSSKHQCYKKMKTTVSEKVSFEKSIWREHTETLIKQGHFLCLAMLNKSDMIWKSCMFNLKKGTLISLLNSRL